MRTLRSRLDALDVTTIHTGGGVAVGAHATAGPLCLPTLGTDLTCCPPHADDLSAGRPRPAFASGHSLPRTKSCAP
jgi:hypothetical protein